MRGPTSQQETHPGVFMDGGLFAGGNRLRAVCSENSSHWSRFGECVVMWCGGRDGVMCGESEML